MKLTKTKTATSTKKVASKKEAVNGKSYVRHVPTNTPLLECDPKGCLAPGIESCPLVSGEAKPYRYQTGCRAEACVNANSRYYKKLARRKARAAKKSAKKKARR